MGKDLTALIINPGSTSTKIAYYVNGKGVDSENLDIDRKLISGMTSIFDQLELRQATISDYLRRKNIDPKTLDYIVSRGGGGGNLRSGAYKIEQGLVQHCYEYEIPHASSLGPVIAYRMGTDLGIPAFIYDGEGVNEFCDLAILSGFKEFPCSPGSHTLNAKAAARAAAAKLGRPMEELNLIVNHLGGGTSTSAHCHGKLIDSTCDGYAAERSGGVPFQALINFVGGCFSGKYTQRDIIGMIMGKGGLAGYLGTSDLREVERRIDAGDTEAKFYFDGMVYQQAKDIAAIASVMNMDVDAIVFTGGMAHSKRLIDAITARIGKIAPIIVVPGSLEMDSLAQGGLRVMLGQEPYHTYGKGIEDDRYYGRT